MMKVTKTLGYCLVLCGFGHGLADSCPAGRETHEVEQLNGKLSRIKSSAGIQIVSQRWGLGAVHYPYMIYMPEKERLLLLVNWGKKPRNKSGVARSDDGGRTWKKPRLVTDAWSVGLTYLGAGNAVFLSQKSVTGPSDRYRFSRDFGQSWSDELPAPGYTDGKPFYEDSQFLVDLDHRYLLATWEGDQKGPGRWHASGQRTSTVLLPDGTLVTAFGAWYRNIVLVRWRIHRQRLSPDSTIADAAYDSKTRNVFAPKISRYARTDPGEKK